MKSRRLFPYIKCFQKIAIWGGVFSVIAYANNSVFAQITPDSTLGVTETSEVQTNVNIQGLPGSLINGGAIRGNNLFHSFSEFNVNHNQRVYFNNPGNIENIISRVTGNKVSNILGTLGIDGNGSLFLINPNGILFGDNAQLHIEGSFLASTAKSLVFENGFEFSTDNPAQPPLLTINMPIGLQLGVNSGQIMLSNESGASPQLNSSQTIGLIANGIVSTGGEIQAGQIDIGSVIDGSEIGIIPESIGFKINYDNVQEFANILINNESYFQVGDLDGTFGNLTINGADITFFEKSNLILQSGNKVTVNGVNISFLDNSNIIVGFGDTLAINGNYITFNDGSDVLLFDSGEITINGKQVNVSNNSLIWSNGSESLTINASNLYINGGLIYKKDGQGNLNIYADESVEIVSVSSALVDPVFASIIFANNSTEFQNLDNNLIIETKDLMLRDGGKIISLTDSQNRGSTISINATNSIEVRGNIQLDEGNFVPSQILAASGSSNLVFYNPLLEDIKFQGPGGDLSINTGKLTVFDQGVVTVSSTTLGDAGTLTITADSVFLDNEGKITATSDNAQGGNINLTVSDLLLMRRNSLISTESLGTESQDGNITIDADLVVTLPMENSDIIARSTNQGNIEITADSIIWFQVGELTPLSDITASGKLTLNVPNVYPSQGLIELSAEVIDYAGQIENSCATTNTENQFIITGRGGLPQSPNGIIRPNRIQDDLGVLILPEEDRRREQVTSPTPQSSMTNPPKQIVEAKGWIIDEQGNVVLTADVPNGTPHGDWQNSVNCQVSTP